MRRVQNFGCLWEPSALERHARVRREFVVQSVLSESHRDGGSGNGGDGSIPHHLRPLLRKGGKSRSGGSLEKPETSAGGSSWGTTTGTMLDIVLIDPSVLSRDILDRMLAEPCHGIRTLSFETLDATELGDSWPSVLVLVQATQHGANEGLLASQIASARNRFPGTPVLAVSEIDTPQACSRAFEAGASGFFPMSGEAQQLLAAVQLLVAGGYYVPGAILAQLFGSGHPGAQRPPSPLTGAPASAEAGLWRDVPESSCRRIILVEERRLLRECLARALTAEIPDLIIDGVATLSDAQSGPAALVLLCQSSSQDVLCAQAAAAKARFPDVPILALLDLADPTAASRLTALGVCGILTLASPTRRVAAAIRLIMAGGCFVPPEMVAGASNVEVARKTEIDLSTMAQPATAVLTALNPDGRFTRREEDILIFLQEGQQNKIIAFKLGISESTVKVHLKNIMKKLDARNRTQALFFVQKLLPGRAAVTGDADGWLSVVK